MYVADAAIARHARMSQSAWRGMSAALPRHPSGSDQTLVNAITARRVAGKVLPGGTAGAAKVFDRLLADEKVAIFRRVNGTFVPMSDLSAPALGAVDGSRLAIEAASPGRVAVIPALPGRPPRIRGAAPAAPAPAAAAAVRGASLLKTLGVAGVAATGIIGIGMGVAHVANGGPGAADGGMKRRAAAGLALAQVRTADATAVPYVAPSGEAAEAVGEARVAFAGSLWKQAGESLGPGAVEVLNVPTLVDWAGKQGKLAQGALPFDGAAPQLEEGMLLVLGNGTSKAPADVGVIVKATADEFEIVQGEPATAASSGSPAPAEVKRSVVRRDDPKVLARIDPAPPAAPSKPADTGAQDGPSSTTTPAPAGPSTAPASPAPKAPVPAAPDTKAPAPPAAPPPPPPAPPAPAGPAPGTPVLGAAPPDVSLTNPTSADLLKFTDWAAAQYAPTDRADLTGAQFVNVLRNLIAEESGFKVNALNMWDRAATEWRTPSYGPCQFLVTTFDGMKGNALAANPGAWSKLGEPSFSDWRHQILTTAWALAQPPTDTSRSRHTYSGDNGANWSQWYGIKNMVEKLGADPKAPDHWQSVIAANEGRIAAPVEDVTTWNGLPPLPPEKLREIAATGRWS